MRNPSGGLGRALRGSILILLASATSVPILTSPAAAAVSVATPAPSVVAAGVEYATEQLGDPWDYSNPEDQRLDNKAAMLNISGAGVSGGRLSLTTQQGPAFDPVFTWPGDLNWGRDGELQPIEAARYTHLSMKMRSSARVAGGVLWFSCPTRGASCQGGLPVQIETGWKTYDIALQGSTTFGTQAWSGLITTLRILPGNAANVQLDIDWMRLYRPGSPVTVTWTDNNPGSAVELFYDLDSNQANNTADNPEWGLLERKVTEGSNQTQFNAAAYPPGSYRFYAVDNGQASPYSEPLVIEPLPIPSIDEPSADGGADYAASVRGNAWDFSGPDDVVGLENTTDSSFSSGMLHATNGPPTRNDPQVRLPLAPVAIDGNRHHRLSFTYSYDGPFGLEDAPNGGTMARIIWQVAGGGALDYQDLNDLVTYQGTNRVVFDLTSQGPTGILDEEQRGTRFGWGGRLITSLRFDPNEDPGARRWHLDDLKLAEDDSGVGGFDIVFRDKAWQAGATADVYYDTDARGFDGELIASDVAVTDGANVLRWSAGGVAPGTYFIYAVIRHGESEARAYSGGPVALRAVSRLAGGDRIETAIRVAESSYAAGAAEAVVLARHDNFPDALAGTPLAGAKQAPLLLTPSGGLDSRVDTAIRSLLPRGRTVYLLGGEGALGPEVESGIRAAGYSVVRLAGADRYETAVRIAEAIGQPLELFITTGTNFPDALSAGPAAIKNKGAVLLTNGSEMPAPTAAFIASRTGARRYAIGAQAAAADRQATDLSGSDRFETSRRVAERFFVNAAVVGVASGVNFPDALSGGAHAAKSGAPLVLTLPDGLPPTIGDYLVANRGSLATGVLYGGEVAVSEAVRSGVEAAIA